MKVTRISTGTTKGQESRPRQTLYRILRYEHLVRLFEDRQYTLLSPFAWEDPFEKLWTRLVFKDETAHSDIESRVFGSCLTFQARSDAMWSIYSRNWLGIRITVDLQELKRQAEAAPELANGRMWIGEVNYLRDAELEKRALTLMRLVNEFDADQMEAIAMAWLNKRIAFKHEDEIRVLLVLPGRPSSNGPANVFKFTVDPHALIKSIHIDPRAPTEISQMLQRDIKANLGFEGSVQQSSLLRLPARLQALLSNEGGSSEPGVRP
jgi:hypothetical protein